MVLDQYDFSRLISITLDRGYSYYSRFSFENILFGEDRNRIRGYKKALENCRTEGPEYIRNLISRNSHAFIAYAKELLKESPPPFRDALKKAGIDSDSNTARNLLELSGLSYIYDTRNFLSRRFSFEGIYHDILSELYLPPLSVPEPTEINERDRIFSIDFDCNDIYWFYSSQPYLNTRKKAGRTSARGKLNMPHMLAEDYGLYKDALFISCAQIPKREIREKTIRAVIKAYEGMSCYYSLFDSSLAVSHLPIELIKNNDGVFGSVRYSFPERKGLLNMLRMLEPGKWYGKSDLYHSFRKSVAMSYGNLSRFEVFYPEDAVGSEDGINCFVDIPLFQCHLIVLTELGILRLAERMPERLIASSDTVYAVSLTEYGQWALGLTDEKPGFREIQEDRPYLDSRLLTVTYNGKNPLVYSFLSSIGERKGQNLWIASREKAISSPIENTEILSTFHSVISADPPENWKAFLSSLEERKEIMEMEEPGYLFRVSDTAEFTRFVNEHPDIRKYITVAENGMIFVRESKLPILNCLMEKYGKTFTKKRTVRYGKY